MLKKILIAGLLLLPTSAFADKLGSLNVNSDVELSTQAVPGGSDTQPQYNDNGAFGGISSDTYNNLNGFHGWGTTSPIRPFHFKGTTADPFFLELTNTGDTTSDPGFLGPIGLATYWNPGYDVSTGDTLYTENTQWNLGGARTEAGEWATTVMDSDSSHFTVGRGMDLVRAGKSHLERGRIWFFYPTNDTGGFERLGFGEGIQNYAPYEGGTYLGGGKLSVDSSLGFDIGKLQYGSLSIGAQPLPDNGGWINRGTNPMILAFQIPAESTGTVGIAVSSGATQDTDRNSTTAMSPSWVQMWLADGRIKLPKYPTGGYLYVNDDHTVSTTTASGSGDNLGNHTATQNLAMAGYGISNAGSYQSTGTVSARWVNASDNVKTSSMTLTRAATPPVIASTDSIRFAPRGTSGTGVVPFELFASSAAIAGDPVTTSTNTQTLTNKTIDANNTALTLPKGTAPTVDAVGKIGFDTTDNIVIAHNGTEQFLVGEATQTVCVTILSGSSWDSQTVPILTAPGDKAVTIRSIKSEIIGGTSLAWNMDTRAFGSANSAGTSWFTASQSASQAGITSLTAQTIAADSTLYWKTSTSAASGTVNAIRLTIRYSENVE